MPDIYQPGNPENILPPALGTNPFQPPEGMTGQYQGFSTGIQSALQNFQMAPIRKMEIERQRMGLERGRQLMNEFMSPEAKAARASQYPAMTASNQLKALQTQGEIEMEPTVHAAKVEEARQHLAETRGKPAGLLLEELGNSAQMISQAPEGMRPHLYEGLVKGIESRYPGMEFPDEWKKFTPETMSHLSALHEAAINTPKQGQAERNENIKGRWSAYGQQIRGVEAASIRQQYHEWLKATGQLKENPGQELARIRRELSNPKLKPEDRSSLETELDMAVSPLIDDKLAKKYGNESNAIIMERASPGFMAQRQKLMDAEREQMRQSFGLKRSDGRVRITNDEGKTFSTIPQSQLKDFLKKNPKYKEAK